MFNYLVRVKLPDRPGALGAVASRIGAVGGDVISIEILQRDNGVVVDELGVGLEHQELIDLLRDEVLEVDGASLESVRLVDGAFPDRHAELLDVATELFKQTSATELLRHLVERVHQTMDASFTAIVDADTSEVVASAGALPDAHQLMVTTRWASEPPPATAGDDWTSSSEVDSLEPLVEASVATADMMQASLVLVVGRRHPVLRARERQWISIMAELADHGWRVSV